MRRPWLLPLVPVYGMGLRVADALRSRPRVLTWPVISVGSLSAGGAGKTPVVMMLARLLHKHGVCCDVLSRGYGRGSGLIEQVHPAGDARRFGDEPLEMAQAGLQVWVGADRFEAGKAAETNSVPAGFTSRVHLLDDGFQHRRLARALDVVLLTLEDVQDRLLPAGNLREPLRTIARADVLVVRQEEAASLEPWTRGRDTWIVRRQLTVPENAPHRPVAFCGIARPGSFFTGLITAGCTPVKTMVFPDHHPYSDRNVARLRAIMRDSGADGFITTAKDAVKLNDLMRNQLGQVVVADLCVTPIDAEAVWSRLRPVVERGPA